MDVKYAQFHIINNNMTILIGTWKQSCAYQLSDGFVLHAVQTTYSISLYTMLNKCCRLNKLSFHRQQLCSK